MHTLVRRADSGCVLIKSHLVDFSRCHVTFVYIHIMQGVPALSVLEIDARNFWTIRESISTSKEREEGEEMIDNFT